jgi:hypothetical protein
MDLGWNDKGQLGIKPSNKNTPKQIEARVIELLLIRFTFYNCAKTGWYFVGMG